VSVLTTVPQDWTRPELPELRDLLVLAYRRPDAAEQIADEAGLAPGTFPHLHNIRATWTELIRELGNQAILEKLVKKAAADPTAAAYRDRFVNMLGDRPEVQARQDDIATDEWWKGDDRAPAVATRLFPQRLMERRTRLMPIRLAQQVTTAARSVARLALRFGDDSAHGTGFLIGPRQILTNHHNVVMGAQKATGIVAEFDYEEGFHGKALVRKGRVDSIVSAADNDWAVVTLDAAVDRPVLALGTTYDIGVNDTVVIIQHPKGAFKQFSLEPLAIRHVDAKRIQYVADTQQGSSGSPVFNSRMEVIALHHAEAETTVKVNGASEVLWRNQGIHIEQVKKALKKRRLKFTENE
jgi:V8-like Glu-specific endopeptidase